MTIYISLLRGVNVGGRKIIMNKLKKLYESLKFSDVKTYIQSGNVIFKSSNNSSKELEEMIENRIREVFDFHIPIFIRTTPEFESIINNNPFPREDPKKIYVTFLRDTPVSTDLKEINTIKDESEKCLLNDKELYLLLPHGYGRTRLSNNLVEKKLQVLTTTRNWRTVNKLYELAHNN